MPGRCSHPFPHGGYVRVGLDHEPRQRQVVIAVGGERFTDSTRRVETRLVDEPPDTNTPVAMRVSEAPNPMAQDGREDRATANRLVGSRPLLQQVEVPMSVRVGTDLDAC